jgi:hypothetical protein
MIFEKPITGKESQMNLFQLRIEREWGTTLRSRTWLIVADSLIEAISVVPEGFSVKSVEVRVSTAVHPHRLIKSTGAPVVH